MLQIVLIVVMFFGSIIPKIVSAKSDAPPVLTVEVQGIQKRKGEIGVAVFDSQTGYPIHIEHSYETEWVPTMGGKTSVRVVFDSLPPGEFAVSVIHDENGNRKLERSTLGFPEEGVGFSNDQKVTLRAPRFEQSKFPLAAGEHKKIVIQMDYRNK